MHFHPFGIPVDEFIVAGFNALQVPPAVYVGMAKDALARVRGWVR